VQIINNEKGGKGNDRMEERVRKKRKKQRDRRKSETKNTKMFHQPTVCSFTYQKAPRRLGLFLIDKQRCLYKVVQI
jgi:hypothetical protein